jgi:hypothetical protein
MSLFLLRLRDTSSRNTSPPPSRRSEWGSSLSPDCFVSRGSISTWVILNILFLRRGVISTSPNPQAGGPPLVACPRLLIQFMHSYPPYWRPFLHPQPEDAPCRGDRDPHSWLPLTTTVLNRTVSRLLQSASLHGASPFGWRRKCWSCLRFCVRRILYTNSYSAVPVSLLRVGTAPKFTFSLGPELSHTGHGAK